MQQGCPDNDRNDQFVFDSKQTAWIFSAFLLVLFFVFMVGYFLGRHQAVEQFSHALDQESISDKIYSSLYASYEGKTGIEIPDAEKIENDKIEANHLDEVAPDEKPIASKIEPADEPLPNNVNVENKPTPAAVRDEISKKTPQPSTYYAPLIGFGSQKSALTYVNRLMENGFPVELKLRSSKTAKGRVIRWYQIVTKPFASRNELEKIIATLEKKEHLTNVKIVPIQ